ncbi:MAG: hypothetical protein ACOC5K_03715, partial [Chloroflexota bacterium]
MRPTDATRLLLFQPAEQVTQAFTPESAAHPGKGAFGARRYLSLAIRWGAGRRGWIACESLRAIALLRLGQRNGPAVWEIKELHLDYRADPETHGRDVFEEAAAAAAAAGAQRLFVRLAEDSPLRLAAARAGYSLIARETLYRREEPEPPDTVQGEPESYGWRPMADGDLTAAFRLYCQTTPPDVRTAGGMTITEWRAAVEPSGAGHEMILDGDDGRAAAWARWRKSDAGLVLSLMLRREAVDHPGELLRGILAGAGDGKAYS